MANVKNAVGNILDAVVTTSNAVSNTVSMVGKGATYGSNWMDSVLKKQSITLKIDNEIFASAHVETKAQELAQIRLGIEQWADTNARRKELYVQSLAQLRAVIEPTEKKE